MPFWKCCPLIYSFKLYICQDRKKALAYTAQNTEKTHISLVLFSVYPRSRRGAERIRQHEAVGASP